jgi:hypothetical protein
MIMSENSISVGVVISTTDSTNYLRYSIDSLRTQSTKFENYLLFLNGILDKTHLEIINDFAIENTGNITILKSDFTLPFSEALNKLLEQCGTEFFLRHDPDDVSLSNRFEVFSDQIKETNADIIYSNIYEIDFRKRRQRFRLERNESVSFRQRLISRNFISHSSVCLRVPSILEIGGYRNIPFAEDYDLWIRSFSAGLNFVKIDDYLVGYNVTLKKRASGLKIKLNTNLFLIKLKKIHLKASGIKFYYKEMLSLIFLCIPYKYKYMILNALFAFKSYDSVNVQLEDALKSLRKE